MKRILYFGKRFLYDILATIFALALTFITYGKAQFFVSIIIIFVYLVVIILLRLRDRDFYFIPLTQRRDKDNWIGRGIFEYSKVHKCFFITNADPGYIYSKCLNWSNYKYAFEFKIIKNHLGVVLRAVNLSNYVMLQIALDGINPHIRINGGWSTWGHKQSGLSFRKKLSLDTWYKCDLYCENDSVNIKIFDEQNKVFDREWQIPTGSLVFKFKKDEESSSSTNIPFPINLEYGSIGFRNWGREKALIKSILIKKN